MPTDLKNLLIDMGLIISIKEKTKLCVKNRCIVDSNSWIGWIYRRAEGENYYKTIEFINNITDNICNYMIRNKYSQYNKVLIQKMIEFRDAIIRLKNTYSSNIHLNTSLDVDLIKLNEFIMKNEVDNISDLNLPIIKNTESTSSTFIQQPTSQQIKEKEFEYDLDLSKEYLNSLLN